MNSARDAAVEFIKWRSPEHEFLFTCLVMQTRGSKHAWDIVSEIYRLAATREWQPDSAELKMLVFAPLTNPALATHIESDMDQILSYYPNKGQLRLGWRYVQYVSCNLVLQQSEVATCSN